MDCDFRRDIFQRCERVLTLIQENTQSEHETAAKKARAKLGKFYSEMENPPKLTVAVYGDTGCGKSSLLNALLGHPFTVPSGGTGKACTSVVIKIEENKQNDNFEADVEFITKEEWEREINRLTEDLTMDNDDSDDSGNTDVRKTARAKVTAVYGEFKDGDLRDIIKTRTEITEELEKEKLLSAEQAKALRDQIKKYIVTTDDPYQYWPIVRQVKVRVPRSEVCESGTELIDLPGVQDSNPARDNIANEYMDDCDLLMIVTDIIRGVDSKTAKDVLGQNLFNQVQRDHRKVVVVCTRTDIVQPDEVISDLNLPQADKWEERHQKYTKEEERLEKLREDADWTSASPEMCMNMMKLMQEKEALKQLEKEKISTCVVERNKYVKRNIQNRASPSDDTVLDMPVFCVSSTEYLKHFTSDEYNKNSQVFISAEQTEIPKVAEFLKTTAKEKQLRNAEYLKKECSTVISDLTTYLSISEGGGKAHLEQAMTRELEDMESEIQQVVTKVEEDIQEVYDQYLNQAMEKAAQVAKEQAKNTTDYWGSPVKRGGLCYGTYKATVNRDGKFKSSSKDLCNKDRNAINMNQELADPFLDQITPQWGEIFSINKWQERINGRIKEPAEEVITNCSNRILQSIQTLAFGVSGLPNDLGQLKMDTIGKLDRLDKIGTIVQRKQRKITAKIPPYVQDEMKPIYEKCKSVKGKHPFEKIKDIMEKSIQQQKDTIFQNVKGYVVNSLEDLKKDVIDEANGILKEICEDYRRQIEPLWQEQYGKKLVEKVHLHMDQLKRLKKEIDEADRSLFVGTSRKRKSKVEDPQGVEQPKVPKQM